MRVLKHLFEGRCPHPRRAEDDAGAQPAARLSSFGPDDEIPFVFMRGGSERRTEGGFVGSDKTLLETTGFPKIFRVNGPHGSPDILTYRIAERAAQTALDDATGVVAGLRRLGLTVDHANR